MTQPILALTTPRQSTSFLNQICAPYEVTPMVVSRLTKEALKQAVERVHTWKKRNPQGVVVSLSDEPSLVHAFSGEPGASLDAILATLDKAWARATVLKGLGSHHTCPLLASDTVIPSPSGIDNETVMIKPLEGCASAGIVVGHVGDPAPDVVLHPAQWVKALRHERLGPSPYPTNTVATVEPYVLPSIPRVSVDGWVDASGRAHRYAISDNIYVEGEPERFDHQMFPSRISPHAADVCWSLYETIVDRLVKGYGLKSQAFDVEMFVYDGDKPRAEVMEVNARIHPNITPVLQRCLVGADPIQAAMSSDVAKVTTKGASFGAGAMYYVWSDKERWDDTSLKGVIEGREDVAWCPFDVPGTPQGRWLCQGWLYLFGDDPGSLRQEARQILEASDLKQTV